ncbi:MAG: T9SS type A sorting domain-containing protein [Candidatus Cloacimonetes bacterium]|nr:T9SS type A sorting domain-containing protein [Candidatus Cloacimonadota bacterium]
MRARTVWNEDVFTATSVEDYGEIEDYTLVVTASQEPVTLTKELTAGWNWISLNLECDDGTVSGILSSIGENGAYIKNQSTFATYYSGVGWIGTMTAFELTSLYKLQMDNAADWVITGFPADPLDYVNNLTAGWNWISYLPQESLDINQALATLASAADYIKNVASFSTYYPGVGWFGTLSVMNPLEGYMIDMNSPADLIYPSGLARNSKVEIFPDTARRRWLVNPADYEFNGSIVASVLDMEPGDELAVFTGDECRGVSQLLDTRKLFGQYTFALMAFTNETAGEDITFRFYDQSADAEYELKGNIHFLPDAVIGDFSQPLLLTLPALYGGENLNSVTALGRCIPNPFNPSGVIWYDLETGINVKIEVYNIRGQKITTLVDQWQGRGKHNIEWRGIDDAGNDVASGIYLIQMKTASYQAMKRIILLK